MSWQHERTMTPDRLRWALQDLQLSQAAAGRFLNLSSRHVARMLDGEAIVPVPIALLLSSMLEHGETPVDPKE